MACPSVSTIGRMIADAPDKMRSHPSGLNLHKKVRKQQMVKRKPKGFVAKYPGHCVALDTIERRDGSKKRYILIFTDVYSRFAFAWALERHSAKNAKVFLEQVKQLFPFPTHYVLTDNGSEFKGFFAQAVENEKHWHTYPKTPKMNSMLH